MLHFFLLVLIAILVPFVVWTLLQFVVRLAWAIIKKMVSIIFSPIGWILGGLFQ